jgi:molybdopterin-guanine dinucleotide biosynthesis protein A
MAREETAAIVLAGGASSRFGADKLTALLDGRPLLHHALAAVDEVAATIVIVLAPDATAPSLPVLRGRLLVAHDAAAHQGPLAGLAAGLAVLPAGVERAVLVGGDMPSLVPAVLATQLAALDADPLLGAVTLETEPPSSLPMALRPSLLVPAASALLAADRRALQAVLASGPSAVVPATVWRPLDPDARTLHDVDTPQDLPTPRPSASRG